MLSKCLNASCSATFQYLRQGRLFRIDFADAGRRSARSRQETLDSRPSNACRIEHFWLCEKCAATLTIKVSDAGEICLVPFGVLAEQPSAMPAVQTYESREATAP
jgi:hypothetical protein